MNCRGGYHAARKVMKLSSWSNVSPQLETHNLPQRGRGTAAAVDEGRYAEPMWRNLGRIRIPSVESLKSLLLLEKVPAAAGECGGDTYNKCRGS